MNILIPTLDHIFIKYKETTGYLLKILLLSNPDIIMNSNNIPGFGEIPELCLKSELAYMYFSGNIFEQMRSNFLNLSKERISFPSL